MGEHKSTKDRFLVIYKKPYDEIVAIGSIAECAAQMGKTPKYIRELCSYIRNGRNKTYELYCED